MVIDDLVASGFKEQQAKALLEAVRKLHAAQPYVSEPHFTEFKSEMKDDFVALRQDFSGLEFRLAKQTNELTRWMFGGFMAVIALLVTVLLRMPQ